MEIVVISLPTATARRASASGQLEALNLQYQFFDAVDGRSEQHALFDRYDAEAFVIHYGRPATPGELGCYASHYLVWEYCVQLGKPILVLEDVFLLAEFFLNAFSICSQLIDEQGYIRLQQTLKSKARFEKQIGEFALVKYTKSPQGGLCYALTPAVAGKFMEHSARFVYPLDVFVRHFWIHRIPLYGLTPYVADNGVLSQESYIGDRAKVRKSLPVTLRRFAHKVFAQVMTTKENLSYNWTYRR